MPRHKLTPEEQKRGVESALKSPRTPPQLKKGLERRKQQLESGSASGGSKKSAGKSR
jgi:hypothetical protein